MILGHKVREEEIKWKQRSRCQWLKEGDKNTKFFRSMASARMRGNRITSLMVNGPRLENWEGITSHILDFFLSLYTKDDQIKPSLENLHFSSISEESTTWLEGNFLKEEVKVEVFNLGSDKAPGPNGFQISFFPTVLGPPLRDIMALMKEFHPKGRLSKIMGASFIALIPKKSRVDCMKDFRTNLICSIHEILAKVLARKLQKKNASFYYLSLSRCICPQETGSRRGPNC